MEELYTLILRLGSGSNSGEFVMGILSEESCKAYMGPRYTPALAVRSGCIEGCSSWGVSGRKTERLEMLTCTMGKYMLKSMQISMEITFILSWLKNNGLDILSEALFSF